MDIFITLAPSRGLVTHESPPDEPLPDAAPPTDPPCPAPDAAPNVVPADLAQEAAPDADEQRNQWERMDGNEWYDTPPASRSIRQICGLEACEVRIVYD